MTVMTVATNPAAVTSTPVEGANGINFGTYTGARARSSADVECDVGWRYTHK